MISSDDHDLIALKRTPRRELDNGQWTTNSDEAAARTRVVTLEGWGISSVAVIFEVNR